VTSAVIWAPQRPGATGPAPRREREPVSLDQLCEDLWLGSPPAGAVSALHAHISRLRGALEPQRTGRAAARTVVRRPLGYRLPVPQGALDTHCFEAELETPRRLLAAGDAAAALCRIEPALDSWRGPALADADGNPFAVREKTRLEEARAMGRELRITAHMAHGTYGNAALHVRELATDEPLRESAWNLLLRALYQSGRNPEALRQCDLMRAVLRRELGVEPGPALRELRSAIQRHMVPAPGRASSCPSSRRLSSQRTGMGQNPGRRRQKQKRKREPYGR
jgi:DNA-binding SARP family transcriptional activator